MAWNHPESNSENCSTRRRRSGKKVSSKSCWEAACIVAVIVIFAGVSTYWPRSDRSQEIKPAPKSTTDATMPKDSPAPVRSQEVVKEEDAIDISKLSPAWRKFYDGRDTNMWKVVYNPITKREYLSRRVKYGRKNAPPPLYHEPALNILDAIAFKPIISVMPNVRIDDRYMKSLQNAMIEGVTIDSDDPEDIKVRKQGMIDLMADLKNRLKNGEDIQKLISDSLADRNRIAQLKQLMHTERANMKRNGASEEEIAEFVKACNKKLEECGATPLVTAALVEARISARQEIENPE